MRAPVLPLGIDALYVSPESVEVALRPNELRHDICQVLASDHWRADRLVVTPMRKVFVTLATQYEDRLKAIHCLLVTQPVGPLSHLSRHLIIVAAWSLERKGNT